MQEAARWLFWHGRSSGYWGLTFTAEEANSTISMTHGTRAPILSLVTSVNNGKTWEMFIPGETTITLAEKGDSVWFAAGEGGNTGTASASSTLATAANSFSMTGRISANGSIMSLLNASKPTYECGSKNTFSRLFINCTSLITTPQLPATTLANNCYQYMFQNCTSLTTAPELPATTLAQSCYQYMFQNCQSLTTAPSLPVTTLAQSCYSSMFRSCKALKTAPALPATILADYCYSSMFYGCTALITAPELPAETLVSGCYYSMFRSCKALKTAPDMSTVQNIINTGSTQGSHPCGAMFYGCTALITAPELPAKTLGSGSYYQMFYGCTSLTTAPALPATTLADYCYYGMFQNCTSLTIAPELPAITLEEACYRNMFYGCTALTTPPSTLPAIALTGSYTYQYMFYGCSNLEKAPVICLTTTPDSTQQMQYMFQNCSKLKEIEIHITSWPTTTTIMGNWVSGVSASGTFICPPSLGTNDTIERGVSRCPTGWNVVPYWGLCFTAEQSNSSVAMTATSGAPQVNLMYSKTGWDDWAVFTPNETVVNLPNVGDKVYIKAGEGGNKYLADLISPAVKHNSFTLTGRIAASGNIQSLANGDLQTNKAIGMGWLFANCSQLTTPPCLPATNVSTSSCYSNLFENCTSLTTAPELPATSVGPTCYRAMFKGCTSLQTAPEIMLSKNWATAVTNCLFNMFYGCTSLNHIKVRFSNWGNPVRTSNWVVDVAASGTFECPATLGTNETITRGTSNCPTDWTVVNI